MKTLLNIFIGLGLGLLTIIIHEELNELKRLELTSFLLVLIGSVYYGFALLSKHKKTMIIEIIVATIFIVMGVLVFGFHLGYWLLDYSYTDFGILLITIRLLISLKFLNGIFNFLRHL